VTTFYFSYEGEIRVGNHQYREAMEAGLSCSALALLMIDNNGQTEYYKRHGGFVTDHLAFANTAFKLGLKYAVQVPH
jgi:hypothetical protein